MLQSENMCICASHRTSAQDAFFCCFFCRWLAVCVCVCACLHSNRQSCCFGEIAFPLRLASKTLPLFYYLTSLSYKKGTKTSPNTIICVIRLECDLNDWHCVSELFKSDLCVTWHSFVFWNICVGFYSNAVELVGLFQKQHVWICNVWQCVAVALYCYI